MHIVKALNCKNGCKLKVMGVACQLSNKLPAHCSVACHHGKCHIDNKRDVLYSRNPQVWKHPRCDDSIKAYQLLRRRVL
ncbi:MAG: hypothetical protein V8Q93_08245 [Blautia faecis]